MSARRSRLVLQTLEYRDTPSSFGGLVTDSMPAAEPIPEPPTTGYNGTVLTAEIAPRDVLCSTQPVDSTGNPLDNSGNGGGSTVGGQLPLQPAPIAPPMFPPTSPIV